jgi:hypothetical protein
MEKITEAFADTGKVIEREPTDQELTQNELDNKSYAEATAEKESKATARAALLERLGITSDEAVLLLG